MINNMRHDCSPQVHRRSQGGGRGASPACFLFGLITLSFWTRARLVARYVTCRLTVAVARSLSLFNLASCCYPVCRCESRCSYYNRFEARVYLDYSIATKKTTIVAMFSSVHLSSVSAQQ